MNTIRLTLHTGPGSNAYEEGQALAEFLFSRCPGNVAEAGVLAYLRRLRAASAAHPGTGADLKYESEATRRLAEAAGD